MGLRDLLRNVVGSKEEGKEFRVDFSSNKFIKVELYEKEKKVEISQDDEDIFSLLSFTNLELSNDCSYIYIDYDYIYDLYYSDGTLVEDYKLLGLPELYNGMIKVNNVGNFIQDKEVRYSFGFEDININYDINLYKNNIINLEEEYRVLPLDMYNLIKKIKSYNNNEADYKDIVKQFEVFADIKEFSNQTNTILHSRLSKEEKPIIVDDITVDFNKEDEGLEIYPVIKGEDEEFNQDLIKKFDQSKDVKNFYNISKDGKKRKVVFKNKETANKIKKNRFLSGEEELKFYRGENELWEDDNLDLSNYGPRVKGFGYLTYRVNDSFSNNKNDNSWFDLSNEIDFPHLYTNTDNIKLAPSDEGRMKEKLVELKDNSLEVIKVEFKGDDNKIYKVPMSEEQLVFEIKKIKGSIVDLDKVTDIEEVENIRKKVGQQEEQEYLPLNGRYIRTYNLDYVDQHLQNLKEKEEVSSLEDKNESEKKKSILIEENLYKVGYEEKIERSKDIETEVEIPGSLKATLFPHQEKGLNKFQKLYKNNKINGILLADDMGLGKTLQILSFLAWLKEKSELKRALIVAPTTLIDNWDNSDDDNPGEIQKFFPKMIFNTYKLKGRIKKGELDEIRGTDIVFTSYNSLRINSLVLGKVPWTAMICDEAQRVKNATTQVSVAVKAQNANFKIACSATPIENNLMDLWNIMDFSLPGILGSRDSFKRDYIKSLSDLPETDIEKRREINDKLIEQIDDNFIRRSKKDELDNLPKKVVKLHGVSANDIELSTIKDLNRLREQGENHLPLIQKLVALCSHPTLIDNNSDYNIEFLLNTSSKLNKIKEIIDPIKEKGEKVLIFTVFKRMQKILIRAINHWYEFYPKVLNGEISQSKRKDILDEFRKSKGFNIIILSPEVAGVGITLTEANHVIHYTRLWNPAKEDQATDRVYRIGQTKDVYVHYPILTLEDDYSYIFNSDEEYIDKYLNETVQKKSPEEKLNKLLAQKKNLLMNFFFAAGDSNISWSNDDEESIKSEYINMDNIFKLITPDEFEILISKLYERKGYRVYPTLKIGDNGVDIVAIKDNKLTLIQCKQVKSDNVSRKAILEVYGGKNIYSNNLGKEIERLLVVTTAKKITPKTAEIAKQNNVEVISKNDLREELKKAKIYYSEIDVEKEERYSLEKIKRIF